MVKLRITTADMKRWRDAANADHFTLSDWIRRRCDGLMATAPAPKKVSR